MDPTTATTTTATMRATMSTPPTVTSPLDVSKIILKPATMLNIIRNESDPTIATGALSTPVTGSMLTVASASSGSPLLTSTATSLTSDGLNEADLNLVKGFSSNWCRQGVHT
jgi:hypothetical protein